MSRPGLAVAVACWAAPSVAFACPYCVGRNGLGPLTQTLIGAILLLPFVLVYSVARAVRRADRDEIPQAR
ncbi:MAG: hypothetical protein ACYCWW_05380 [Deltaproteobacteria bacterium]